MKHFSHILVPVDFGSPAAHALETAIALARTFGSELTLLHAWEIPVYPYMEFVLKAGDLIASVEDAARSRLTDTLTEVQKFVPTARSILKAGPAWREILDAIAAEHADLVVMGTHGRRGLDRVLLGSVAEKVVRLSPVPVLTVRGKD